PDRVVAHLLGDDTPDPALADALVDVVPVETAGTARLRDVLDAGVRLVHVRQPAGGAAASTAAAALARAGWAAVGLGLGRAGPGPVATARAAVLEATLRGAVLVAEPVDAVADAVGAVAALTSGSGVTV